MHNMLHHSTCFWYLRNPILCTATARWSLYKLDIMYKC